MSAGTIEQLKPYLEGVAALANLFTIVASGLAIYVFFANRSKIQQALELLLNYSFQTTLSELKEKLERLNEYNANEGDDQIEIRNILNEIAGQLRGNDRLAVLVPTLPGKVETLARSKKLTEPAKRAMVSELREQLRNIQVNSTNKVLEQKP